MDFLSKGVKFLQELDEPTKSDEKAPSVDLETSLDGMAERWLGWATGPGVSSAAASKNPKSPSSPENSEGRLRLGSEDDEVEDPPQASSPEDLGLHEEKQPTTGEPQKEEDDASSRQVTEIEGDHAAREQPGEKIAEESFGLLDGQKAEQKNMEAKQAEPAPEIPAKLEGITGDAAPGENVESQEVSSLPTAPEGLPVADTSEDAGSNHQASCIEQPTLPSRHESSEPTWSKAEPQTVSKAEPQAASRPESDSQEVKRLREELDESQNQLQQRERQLSDLSNALAEMEARDTTAQEQAKNSRAKAIQAVEEAKKVANASKKRAQQMEAERDDWKERAAASERRLKQEARDMEQELLKAQETWRERIKKAELKTQEVEREAKEAAAASAADLKEAHEVVAKFKTRLRAQAAGSEETRGELEAFKGKAEEDAKRLNERLRAAGESEMQLRRELQLNEQARQEMQERIAELQGQLERAQQAYSEAAREVGSMNQRLNELEFEHKADSSAEDLLRQELAVVKERSGELEERLKECTWMRDNALQEVKEARTRALKAEEESRQARDSVEAMVAGAGSAEAGSCVPSSPSQKVAAEALNEAKQEVQDLQEQLKLLVEQHQTELQSRAEMSREEINYLKRKNDEKDKRLEILTCERNALRYESGEAQASSSKPSRIAPKASSDPSGKEQLVDLEEGLAMKNILVQEQGASGAFKAFLADGDLVLRRFSKLLFSSSLTRRFFYGYVLLLHIWIWVVLHRAAAVHSAHTIARPVAPSVAQTVASPVVADAVSTKLD
eukprot:TRINITY_DN13952_c0_g1_i1.p1 TRINITY_DN13952_c0_g1~~TRINITY_DN13952_c0_g1_i1.p1  ORF type:complete len:787 (-),score=245.84 TRINITY_DN13952_c0_g1_i1:156-2516(-)